MTKLNDELWSCPCGLVLPMRDQVCPSCAHVNEDFVADDEDEEERATKSTVMKPCPFCRSTDLFVFPEDEERGEFCVCCRGCYAEGPLVVGKETAVRVWNREEHPGTHVRHPLRVSHPMEE